MLRGDIPKLSDLKNPIFRIGTELTDFTKVLGTTIVGSYWLKDIGPLTSSSNEHYTASLATIYGTCNAFAECSDIYIPTRVIINYDDILEVAPNYQELKKQKNNQDTKMLENGSWPQESPLVIEFGKWPQTVVPQTTIKEFRNGIKWTTNKYPVYIKTMLGSKLEFIKSFIYDDREYIIIKPNFDAKRGYLSDNRMYLNEENIILEVSPIKWYLDEENKRLIAKDLLFSGVPLKKKSPYEGNPEFMLKYLDKCFLKAIMQGVKYDYNVDNSLLPEEKIKDVDSVKTSQIESEISLNEKSQKINQITEEIFSLLDDYYGDEDIEYKVNTIINRYNRDLTNLIRSKREYSGLSLDNYSSEEMLYMGLIADLEDISSMLKLYNKKYEVHRGILELIDICLDILDDIDNHDDYLDSLRDDIITIKSVVLPFLKDNNLLIELKELFNKEKENIFSYLKGNEDSPAKDYHDLFDFELKFRTKLMPYLFKINSLAKDKDLKMQIDLYYKNMILNEYQETTNNYLNHLFGEIQKLTDEIIKDGSEEEKSKMQIIRRKELDYNQNILDVLKDIDEMYQSLYKIVLDIEERKELANKYSEYTVTVNARKK